MFRIEYCTCPKIAIRHYKVFSGERVVCCMARLITGNAFDISAVLEEDARQKTIAYRWASLMHRLTHRR